MAPSPVCRIRAMRLRFICSATLACHLPVWSLASFNAQRRNRKETAMERNFEPQREPGQVLSRSPGGSGEVLRTIGAGLAKGGEALQGSLKKTAAAVGNGIQDQTHEVIAYARREPGAALTAAAGIGFLVGLSVALGSRHTPSRRRAWLPRLDSRRSFLGRRAGSGWREFLRLE